MASDKGQFKIAFLSFSWKGKNLTGWEGKNCGVTEYMISKEALFIVSCCLFI